MPLHLISGSHEWINEIPTVPIYYPAKSQPRERAWRNQRGKKTLLSLTLVRSGEVSRRAQNRWEPRAPRGCAAAVRYHYLRRHFTQGVTGGGRGAASPRAAPPTTRPFA